MQPGLTCGTLKDQTADMESRTEPYPHHQSLTLENFTAFSEASFEFCPGVNVLVGENGTGKTHVLKVLYSVQLMGSDASPLVKSWGVKSVFRVSSPEDLFRVSEGVPKPYEIQGRTADMVWRFKAFQGEPNSDLAEAWEMGFGNWLWFAHHSPTKIKEPVFIPSWPIIGSTVGFASTYDRVQMDVDSNVRHLVSQLLSPHQREPDAATSALMVGLEMLLNGKAVTEGERFYIVGPGRRTPIQLEADGIKVLATLERLISVGVLVPGTCLYWDEPEAHLNPSLMDEVIKAILMLSRAGIQVFLATHSYIILKELEVQAESGDHLKFFALEKTADGTKVHEASRYLDIAPNLIEAQYGSLLDRAFAKDFGDREG